MWKRLLIVLAALAAVFGAIFGWKAYSGRAMAQQMASREPPPITVSALVAERQSWQPTLSAIASLTAVRGVELATEVAGRVVSIDFESGQPVKRGQRLLQLDDAADRAELARLQAQAELSRLNLERQRELVRRGFVSQASVDTAASQYRQARAQLESQGVTIGNKALTAPFDGRLGIRQVNLGQYLQAGDPVVTLQSVAPIYADFALPQQHLKDVRDGQPVRLTVNVYPGEEFGGTISAIDPQINAETRNFNLRASLPNEGGKLRPGMFGQVQVLLPQQNMLITLPQTALVHDPYGESVYVIQEGKTPSGQPALQVARRFVVTGDTRGNQIALLKGVEPGERVVVAGQHKLKEGAVVQVDNSVVPSLEAMPRIEQDR